MSSILELVASEEDSFWNDYLQEVAFDGLTPYYKIQQWGNREGTTLGEHVLTGCMLIQELKDICNLTELEEKICLAAYTVHDMNKIERFANKNIPLKKAAPEDILIELERVNLVKIFPEAKEYIDDITFLVRNHAGKFHAMEGLLASNKRDFQLGQDRLEELIELIKGVDVADLSDEFSEEYQKDKFLSKVNIIADKQYQLVNHRLSEHRGILTNLIHNAVSQYLQEEYNYTPVFVYPKGTYYLTDNPVEFSQNEFEELAKQVEKEVNKIVRGKFADFISSTSTGIKIDGKCLDLNVPFEDMLEVVDNRIHSKGYGSDRHTKVWDKVVGNIEGLDQETTEDYKEFFASLTDTPFVEEEFHVAELIRAYYNFLRLDHFNLNSAQAWNKTYELLDVNEEVQAYFELLSGRASIYYRPYALAKYLMDNEDLSYDKLYQLIKDKGTEIVNELQDDETDSLFKRYIYRVLSIDQQSFVCQEEFQANFDYYLDKPHKQCSTCGLDYEVDDWMAGDVQNNIKVQFFSNRLAGGGGEPKRNICRICNKQFVLEKLNFVAHSQTDTFYLHFYPKGFHSAVFLNAFRHTLDKLRGEDNRAIMLKNDQIIIDQLDEKVDRDLQLKFSETKSNGNPLPRYSQVVGNIITLPLNCPGDNDTQRFIFALQQILIWMRYFNFRAILSRNPIPPLAHNEFDELYLDNLPFNLKGVIGKQNLNQGEVEELWTDIKDYYSISSQVDEGTDRRKVYAKLLRTASDNLMELFFVLDRLIIQKADNEREELAISRRVLKKLENLISTKGGEEMESAEVIAKLGELAGKSYIKGKTFKRNSLLKPIDIIFDLLERKSEYLDLETVFATATQQIFDHIKRISPDNKQPGETKYQKIEEFVATFKEDLLEDVYQGKINDLIADQKIIKSAYLFYYRKATQTEE